MGHLEEITKYFKEDVVDLIYRGGGVSPSGYGFLSGGYGGGVDINDFQTLLHIRGFIEGINSVDQQAADRIMFAINEYMKEKYPDEVNDSNVPFIR